MPDNATITADVVEGLKAVESADNGDLIVEGYFATYDLDRQGERFLPQSFSQAAKAFLASGSRPFLYQHKAELGQLGSVEMLEERAKGLWGRARIPRPAEGSPLMDVYQKIRDGYMKGVSIRTLMKVRRLASGIRECFPTDIVEFSATPAPVNAGGVMALASKAFGDDEDAEPAPDDAQAARDYLDEKFASASAAFDQAEAAIQALENPSDD